MKAIEPLVILVVEDNAADCFLIQEMLLTSALPIQTILSAKRQAEALHMLKENKVDLVLLDLSLPDSFGLDSFLQLKDAVATIPTIILTGLSDSALALEALQLGAQDYLVKGEFSAYWLVKSIQYSMERKKQKKLCCNRRKNTGRFFTLIHFRCGFATQRLCRYWR